MFISSPEEKKRESEKSLDGAQKSQNGEAGGGHSDGNATVKGRKRKNNTVSDIKSNKKRKMDGSLNNSMQPTQQGSKKLKKSAGSMLTERDTRKTARPKQKEQRSKQKKAAQPRQTEQGTTMAASSKQTEQDRRKVKRAAVPKSQKKEQSKEKSRQGNGAQGREKKNAAKKLKGILKKKKP